MYKSTAKKSQIIRRIVQENYEPGRQDRCKLWVYRNKIRPILGISERTFFRMLNLRDTTTADPNEPTLFNPDEYLKWNSTTTNLPSFLPPLDGGCSTLLAMYYEQSHSQFQWYAMASHYWWWLLVPSSRISCYPSNQPKQMASRRLPYLNKRGQLQKDLINGALMVACPKQQRLLSYTVCLRCQDLVISLEDCVKCGYREE